MAAGKQDNSSLITALPITVVVAALAGLLITQTIPYQHERPSNDPLKHGYAPPVQDVDARLWQDPFAAVDAISDLPPTTDHKPEKIYENSDLNNAEKYTVLAVTLPGGPYQESEEERMRRRYAVLSALSNHGATPYDEQHIGYFNLESKNMGLQKRVSFEWWIKSNEKPNENIKNHNILLLWVDESSLRHQPADKLKHILVQATKLYKGNPKLYKGNPKVDYGCDYTHNYVYNDDYVVIGPNSSTLLRDMLLEVKELEVKKKVNSEPISNENSTRANNSEVGKICGHEIRYFSAAATASDEQVLNEQVSNEQVSNEQVSKISKCSKVLSLSDCFNDQGVRLKRLTATDHAMMDVLVNELGARGVGENDPVVIISEWDTFYGRKMPESFASIREKHGEKGNIYRYSYMRGLDGKLPEKRDKGDKTAKVNNKSGMSEMPVSDVQIEIPEGKSQKDYLRRLTDRILEMDQRLKKDQGINRNGISAFRNGISAFGILGSDVHDKLMIMEALRPHFPHKIFFTTDLNAIYNHPNQRSITHNLLVASTFDLTLRSELQGYIPPFRDSYQTAFFLATQLGLEHIAKNSTANIADKIPPRLFEIGRSHPVPLPAGTMDKVSGRSEDEGNQSKCSWKELSLCDTLQPRIFTTFPFKWSWLGGMAVGLLGVLSLFVSWRIRKVFQRCVPSLRFWKSPCFWASVILVSGLACLIWLFEFYLVTQPAAEPFYLFEGVSAWPSQLLRLSALLFAISFFLWGKNRIQKMEKAMMEPPSSIHKDYFSLPVKHDPVTGCDALFIGSWEKRDNFQTVSPDQLWKTYLGYGRQKKFCSPVWVWRVMLHGLIFLAAGMTLMFVQGFPNVPVRGDVARTCHFVILIFSVIAIVMLTMLVVENARLCQKLIVHLSDKPSDWNKNATDWAIRESKVAKECVSEYLDIQFVTVLTKTMQPLIWGPMICIGLMILARSPVFDDWDVPWGLGLIFLVMLLYAISAEAFLQRGAKLARAKAIDLLNGKIRELRNQSGSQSSVGNVIIRIETEIERIQALRVGAFRPWYELPLLQSFGGFGTLVFLAEKWAGGS